ncbi:TolC family protein [Parvularcula flava]|nr:TolC family protein [Aquisalinus luteolus]NHK26820.1 TolC family protein [Aquisalinus luteolus]
MKRFFATTALAGMGLSIAACTSVPPADDLVPDAGLYAFPAAAEDGVTAEAPLAQTSTWYETAVSPDLATLLGIAAEQNPAIRIQAKRVEQAEANLQSAEANRWIDVVLTGSGSAEYDLDTNDSSDSQRASLGLDLPLDVTGRLRTLRNAARYNLYTSLATYDQTRNTALRDLSLNVVNASEASLLYRLIEEQIETSRTLLQLTELRFAQGQASIVDVLQQRDQIASLEQQLPPLRANRVTAIDAIATATGTPPAEDDMPALLADIPDITPVATWPQANTLLDTRPDLRASVYALQADNAAYTAAILNRLPSFNLSGSAVSSLVSGNASEFVTATVSGALTVFDSGAKDAAIDFSRAQYEESGILLLQDWLDALAEINGLISQENEGLENIRLTEERLETSRQLLESARRRYRQGASDYLPVLNALSSIQTQERRLINLKAEQARIRIRLHAAIGLPAETMTERTI